MTSHVNSDAPNAFELKSSDTQIFVTVMEWKQLYNYMKVLDRV